MKTIKIGIADDHSITRKGIKSLLESDKNYQVTLEALNGYELIQTLKKELDTPDLLILDLSMPKTDGFELISQITQKYPSIKILIFSFYKSEDVIFNAINKGACGYVSKTEDPEILLEAIFSILSFGLYLNQSIKKKYITQKAGKNVKGFHGKQLLTEKEIQFIRWASSNLTYKEIAAKMNVQPKTLENYRDSIFQKLGINNRASLTLYGIQNGIVQLF